MEKYTDCTSQDFKTDISQLCEKCPLIEKIENGIIEQIREEVTTQKEILNKKQFDVYLDKEIESAQKAMQEMHIIELQNKNNADDPYRRNRIEIYIFNKERIKALNEYKNEAKNQLHKTTFRTTLLDGQLKSIFDQLKPKFIDPDTDYSLFKSVFSEVDVDNLSGKIKWLEANNLLAYFIYKLKEKNFIDDYNKWNVVEKCFTNSKNLSNASVKNKKFGNPKKSGKIDIILNGL